MCDEKIEKLFERTLSLISSEQPCKKVMPDLQRKPLNF